jgi:hypothetical protein
MEIEQYTETSPPQAIPAHLPHKDMAHWKDI